jgi:hypothetical protein
MNSFIANDPSQWENHTLDKDKEGVHRLGHDSDHDSWDYDYLRRVLEEVHEGEFGEIPEHTKRHIRRALREVPKRSTYRERQEEE